MDIQRDIPFNIFEEVEQIEIELETVEDCFYTSDAGNMSLHLLATSDEQEYYIQRYTMYSEEWFKCTDVEKLKRII